MNTSEIRTLALAPPVFIYSIANAFRLQATCTTLAFGEYFKNTAACSNFGTFGVWHTLQLQNMAGPYFGSFGARGHQPTSFGPRDTRGLGPPAPSLPRWATCTSSRTPLQERRLLPSRLLLPTRDAVVSARSGLGDIVFTPVLLGFTRFKEIGPKRAIYCLV